jgi:hypothetical protein
MRVRYSKEYGSGKAIVYKLRLRVQVLELVLELGCRV